ncbi:hypothetical protein SUGI_0667460 [Cryptomeria japonica]|nr:hypothetical protein SUGI_0667460 [Cryptomeria japonica]
MASSSSSSSQERSVASLKLYDAFISHRGPDVKETLAKQLYDLLKERGCRTFLDREEIEGGDSITSAIKNGICSSVVQIAIFSKGYALSSWCLDELVLMFQQTDALFIPVFYDVQPWELRHIQNNKKSQYAAAFRDYERKGRYLDKLGAWKEALARAADISGYELSQYQKDLCEKIVSRVLQEMGKRKPLHVANYPVGLGKLVQDFENSCSETAGTVGIFGLGGSGKSTLAREFFNRKRSGYDESCFLSDVRESHANSDLHSLQSQLLKDLFHDKWDRNNVYEGIERLKDNLSRVEDMDLHFLIILDDIDHQDQLDALIPKGMLTCSSLVILTTRDQSMLRDADIHYKMKGMDKDDAKELFCSHAFGVEGCRYPPTAYEKLIESFVEFCGGLPLSLIVLGAHVYRRDEHYWEQELEKVQKIQPKDIMQRLRISFDGLDGEEKQIFLDIACLFNKKRKRNLKSNAITIWKASGWSAEHAVQTLQDRCLLEVSGTDDFQYFEMHDHLRDLGRQIADELSPPRLWRPELLRSMEAKGFQQILAETNGGRCFHSFEDSSLGIITFFIAETDLLWLEMRGPFFNIPSWILLRKLHCLHIESVQELWSTFQQQLQTYTQATFQLRRLSIWCSNYLEKLPDLIEKFTHLEELDIFLSESSTDTTSFVQSLGRLSKLRSLSLACMNFDFSEELDLSKGNVDSSTSSRMDSLETIRLANLHQTSKLIISGEMCPRLRTLRVDQLGNLKEMELKHLKRLNTLRVESCTNLETISDLSTVSGLQFLKVSSCFKLETISGLSTLTELQVLEVEGCSALKSFLPTLAHLHSLEKIELTGCPQLQGVEMDLMQLERLNTLRLETIELTGCPRGVRVC